MYRIDTHNNILER